MLFDYKFDPLMVRPVYRAARFVCPEKLLRVFKPHSESDAGLERFAAIVGKTGVMSPGGPYVNVTDEELAVVGDPAVLRKSATARLKKLSSRTTTELRSALMSIATGKAYFTTTGKEARDVG